MFKDARIQDRQRTAASFTRALDRYAAHAENWFDGQVGSIDRRLAHCDRLLHSASFTVGRLGMSDAAHRYLQAAEELKQDREVLSDLRTALLTGGAGREVTACDDFASDHHPKTPDTKVKGKQKLSGTDQRWVVLEAARFVAANASTCDDPHELATRAQHHAAVKTSTFTPQRSAEITAAFVAEVGELGSAAPRPMTVRTAALDTDWDAQYMYLC